MDVSAVHQRLLKRYGRQGWWPIQGAGKRIRGYDRRFEVIVGAILTQMVAWNNARQAIDRLIAEGKLSVAGVREMKSSELERLIRPAGFYRQKAKKLKAFVNFLDKEYDGSLDSLARASTSVLREKLLDVKGIGEETADSIILYAVGKPSFVIDAYTRRLCACFGLRFRTYNEYQTFFVKRLPRSVRLWNEYHALIVRWGKDYGTGGKETSREACRLVRGRRLR